MNQKVTIIGRKLTFFWILLLLEGINKENDMKENYLIGTNEICNYLKISRTTLYRYYINRKFPIIKIKGRLFARKSAIDSWLGKFEGRRKKLLRDKEEKK